MTEHVTPRKPVEYHKLVRDRIPEIIRSNGEFCEVSILNEDDYVQALREKLIEEAKEVAEASEEHLITELADLREVMDALMRHYDISQDTVQREQERRHVERGGFDKRLKLHWTE